MLSSSSKTRTCLGGEPSDYVWYVSLFFLKTSVESRATKLSFVVRDVISWPVFPTKAKLVSQLHNPLNMSLVTWKTRLTHSVPHACSSLCSLFQTHLLRNSRLCVRIFENSRHKKDPQNSLMLVPKLCGKSRLLSVKQVSSTTISSFGCLKSFLFCTRDVYCQNKSGGHSFRSQLYYSGRFAGD